MGAADEPRGISSIPIPFDLVERLVGPTGLAMLVRAQMRRAEFKPMARLSVRGGRYVAEVDYRHPIGDETAILVQLGVAARAGLSSRG